MTSDEQLFDLAATQAGEPSTPATSDRAAAARRSALWAAYGDALGWISELTDDAGLRRRTRGEPLTTPIAWKRHIGGRGGLSVMLPAGCYSDDTQLRLAASRAIGPNGFDVEAFAKVELPVWLAYALGGGTSTKSAASNLAKPSTSWFVNTYRGWLDAGGNGAAMRVQPHVWAAPNLEDPAHFLLDAMRNAICTHAHPVALVGAVIHALALAHTMSTGRVPEPADLTRLCEIAHELPTILSGDPEVGHYWITSWERQSRQTFADAWALVVKESFEFISRAANAIGRGSPDEQYRAIVDTLSLTDPDRRGSGQLTAIAATALTWCERRPAEAMVLAANVIGTDTDTIATMAGALLGAASRDEPPGEILDRDLIIAETDRLTTLSLAGGDTSVPSHQYPDLLNWSAPKTQADALVTNPDDELHVLGLGPVQRVIGEPLPAAQGEFAWQWVSLTFGQTLLIKRRNQLPVVHHPARTISDTGVTPQRRNLEGSVSVLARSSTAEDRSETARPTQTRTIEHRRPDARSEARPARPLDLDRVIAYLRREELSDQAIGYAVRRVAREGTPEQVAAFLAVLLDLIRR